jgi:8-oxo-dGTP diphosphatase
MSSTQFAIINNMDQGRPKVGVALLIMKDGKILLGKRKGSHGAGEYAGVGGHLENLESFEECALREMREEAGPLVVTNLRFLSVTNLRAYAPKHYVDIALVADWISGEPQVMEPDKLESWQWYDTNDLPSPLFGAVSNYLKAYKTGKTYFQR